MPSGKQWDRRSRSTTAWRQPRQSRPPSDRLAVPLEVQNYCTEAFSEGATGRAPSSAAGLTTRFPSASGEPEPLANVNMEPAFDRDADSQVPVPEPAPPLVGNAAFAASLQAPLPAPSSGMVSVSTIVQEVGSLSYDDTQEDYDDNENGVLEHFYISEPGDFGPGLGRRRRKTRRGRRAAKPVHDCSAVLSAVASMPQPLPSVWLWTLAALSDTWL